MYLGRFLSFIFLFLVSLHTFSLTPDNTYTGAYFGAGLGGEYGQYTLNNTAELIYPSSSFFSKSFETNKLTNSNFIGAIYLGYMARYQAIHLAPEVFLKFGETNFSNTQYASAILPTETLEIQTSGHLKNYDWAIDLRPGINIHDALWYGRIGVSFNHLEASSNVTDTRPYSGLSANLSNPISTNSIGLRTGSGIEQYLSKHLRIRADWIITFYPNQTNTSTSAIIIDNNTFQLGPITNTFSIRPVTNLLMASIVYAFDNKENMK